MSRFLFLLVLFPVIVFAQFDELQFDYFSVEDGLASCYVSCITQDSSGFIWIGTKNGLNRYDGYKFTVFKHISFDTTGLSDNLINALYFDQSDFLWIGTGSGGLNRYDPKTGSFICFKHHSSDPRSLSSDNILSLYQDKYRNLWIGTLEGGLNQLILQSDSINLSNPVFKHFYHQPGNQNTIAGNTITTIFEDSRNDIWIGTTNGLSKLSMTDAKTIHITNYRHDSKNPFSLSHNNVTTICEDINGKIWIGTMGGGLNKFDLLNEKFNHFTYNPGNNNSLSNNLVSTIQTDRTDNNILWIGTYYGGINRLDIKSGKIKRYEATEQFYLYLKNYIYDLYQDASGLIWAAAWGGGIFKFNPQRNKFFKYQPGLGKGKEEIIWSIYVNPTSNEQIVWLVSAGGGLLKFNRTKNNFTRYLSDLNHPDYKTRNTLINLYGEPKKNNPSATTLWMGSHSEGIIQFDSETEKFKHYVDDPDYILSQIKYQIRSIYPDPMQENILWIGTDAGGLYRYNRQSDGLKQYTHHANDPHSLSHPFVHHILRDQSGQLWISTLGGGLNKMNETDNTFIHFMHNPADTNSLNNNWVNITFESCSGQFWVGTRGGLDRFDREHNTFRHYTEKNGLPNNIVFGILEDNQNNLWLSTKNGLARFNPDENVKESFRNYDAGDGLHGNGFENKAYFKDHSGQMYFGGNKGFTIFNPDQIYDNKHIPGIVLTDLKIYNNSLKPGENSPLKQTIAHTGQITLDYSQNNLTFEFAALDYFNPLKNQYAYKMEGVDPDWVFTDATRRFSTYTQLDPGVYIFRVKGSNNDGIWNEEGTSIKITILPPWWRTNWAYTSYIILIIFTVYMTYYLQLRRMRLKHSLDIEHVHAEKLAEIDHMKSRFFTNISHEFRTPLTLILGPVQSVLSKIGDVRLKNELNVVLRNANRLEHLVNQLLDLSRLEAGKMELKVQEVDVVPLLRKLVMAFTSLAERKNITLKFKCKTKLLLAFMDLDKIEKIMNNLLSNAFKFTPQGGKVEVLLSRGDSSFEKHVWPPDREDKGDFLHISVSNSGSFILPDKIDKIFDRFYRIENSYRGESALSDANHIETSIIKDTAYLTGQEGSGIGLALVRELVELHHGKIDVQCKRKRTQSLTIFTILLPLDHKQYSENEIIKAPQTEDKNAVEMISKDIEFSGQVDETPEKAEILSGSKSLPLVLLIEDNPDMRSYIRDHLQSFYRFMLAADGEKGWQLARKRIPDLIISDIMMPEMDGFQLCQKIKSDIATRHIPLILLTARAELKDKLAGLELGADDYVPKPFAIEELQARIRNLVEQRLKLRERFSQEALFGIRDIALNPKDKRFLKQVMDIVDAHLDDPHFTVQNISDAIGMSRMTLHLKIKALTGQSPHNLIRLIRLKKAAVLLQQKTISVSQVAYEVGFKNLSHFAKTFQKQFGDTPSHFSGRY